MRAREEKSDTPTSHLQAQKSSLEGAVEKFV